MVATKTASVWPAGFQPAPTVSVPRLIGRSVGDVGTGKTHFWLTGPGPIAVQSFDQGTEGVVEQFAEKKKIVLKHYEWSPTDDSFSQADAVTLRDEFITDFTKLILQARTVVWDTESMVWELFRYAEFGGPSENPKNHAALNQRYKRVVSMPKSLTINFGCTQSLKDEWVTKIKANGKEGAGPSGGQKAWGFTELPAIVHINLSHTRLPGGNFAITV